MKAKVSQGIILLMILALLMGACSNSGNDENSPTAATQKESQNIAEQFVKNSPTFAFDGILEALKLTDTLTLRCPSCWTFVFEFDSRHAGYGNRTGQILAQVITLHTATITVVQGEVTQANLDEKWDMIEQKEITSVVGGPCKYTDIPGTARITSIKDADPNSANCNDAVEVIFDFTPDSPSAIDTYSFPNWKDTNQSLTFGGGMNPSREWVEKQGLKEGSELACIRSEITEGTCTPVIFSFPTINFEGWQDDCYENESGEQVAVDTSFSGKEIKVKVGQLILVALASNQTTGFKWELISNSDEEVLQKTSYRYEGPKTTEPPALGAGGKEVWTFKALKEGTSTISMAYSRPWESVPPAETFVLPIQVGPQESGEVGKTEIISQVKGDSAFAFDLYQLLSKDEGNLFYSPYSISLALAMTYAGARSQTEQQMADTLHFILSQENLPPAFKSLALELARRGQSAQGKDGEGFRLNIVNAIWGQEGYQFLAQYLNTLENNYGAGLRPLDFENAPEESRITINNWASNQTEGRIKDLIPQGVIDILTRLVLTNAVDFNAAWQHPFVETATSNGAFHLLDGKEVSVPMMRQAESLGYTSGEGYQAVELPYDGHELSMVILLPDTGNFKAFEASLSAESAETILDDLAYRKVALTLPKFTFDSSFGLSKTLADMGMPDAFDPSSADFSGMDGSRDLYIKTVIHKAFISVDEAGTEAAAATAVVVGVTSIETDPPIQVTVDRPFIFLIRDIETGTILFLGHVINPAA
ncbi:MAG: serpin family protein [Dehalococcoidia bacterium]|nr:serpin family protein [Dehalococcoidia bacterium]